MENIRTLELFGGIGALSTAMEKLGIPHEIIDYVENDKYAVKSFNAIHNTNFNPQDIRTWDKDIKVDLIMHGSPCQDFSLAGKQAGGDAGSGTRSSLLYETVRIVQKLKPKYVIWENVKNILSQKHRHNFDNYLKEMEQLGYTNYYQVLNAKDYGIPQNRERVFTVSILGEWEDNGIGQVQYEVDQFEFPQKQELKIRLKDLLEKEVEEKFYLSEKMVNYIKADNEKWTGNNGQALINKTVASTINTGEGSRRCDASNYIASNIDQDNIDLKQPKILIKNATKQGYMEGSEGDGVNLAYPESKTRRGRVGNQVAQTLQCNDSMGVIDNLRIRKLTPKECWRLMGFDDDSFNKASQVNSNAQLYKQAGNSIVVNVLESILNNLIK